MAKIGPQLVRPAIAGRIGGALGLAYPHRVSSVLAQLPPDFLAAAAPYIDARVIPHLAPGIDADLLVQVALLLIDAGDTQTCAMFAAHCDTAVIPILGDAFDDGSLMTAV